MPEQEWSEAARHEANPYGHVPVDGLNTLVTSAIHQAESLEGSEDEPAAWKELSLIEEELARRFPADGPEGQIARWVAVRAAGKSGDIERAKQLVNIYSDEVGASEELKKEIKGMLRQAKLERVAKSAKEREAERLQRMVKIVRAAETRGLKLLQGAENVVVEEATEVAPNELPSHFYTPQFEDDEQVTFTEHKIPFPITDWTELTLAVTALNELYSRMEEPIRQIRDGSDGLISFLTERYPATTSAEG